MAIHIALAKGRIHKAVMKYLADSGYEFPTYSEESRRLIFEDAAGQLKVTLVKSPDVAVCVDIIKLNGSVELAPIVGLSDVIVDIVETGNTLNANGLEVLNYFMDFSARMICNPVSFKMKYRDIQLLMDVIRQHSIKA